MSNLLVMKFGGTSMGSAERIRTAAELTAREHAKGPTVVIVSAMSKVTDLLLDSLRKAEAGDRPDLEQNLKHLSEKHVEACKALLPASRHEAALATLAGLIDEFSRIAKGIMMLGERPPRSVDEAISIGERLSATLMAEYLESTGVRAQAVNAAQVIATDGVFGNASPLMDPTRENAQESSDAAASNRGILPVVTGFNGATAGRPSHDSGPRRLGFLRLDSGRRARRAELWIWTDVDGIMTADPRLVPGAPRAARGHLQRSGRAGLQRRQGAASRARSRRWSKSRSRCGARTASLRRNRARRIVPQVEGPGGPRARHFDGRRRAGLHRARQLAAVSGTQDHGPRLGCPGSRQRRNSGPHQFQLSPDFLLPGAQVRKWSAATEALEEELSLELAHGYLKPLEVDENVGLIAVVGEGMRGTPGLAGRIFTAISRHEINIIAIAQGSSELTIGIVVRREGLERAVRAIHEECGLGV